MQNLICCRLLLSEHTHISLAAHSLLFRELFKAFYPDRRLVVDFMPHTYSRTGEFFDGFVTAFDATDVLILHAVYPSARETLGSPTGRDLFNAVRDRRASTYYFEEHNEAVSQIANLLLPGDLFLTLGAGDNWKVGQSLFRGEAS